MNIRVSVTFSITIYLHILKALIRLSSNVVQINHLTFTKPRPTHWHIYICTHIYVFSTTQVFSCLYILLSLHIHVIYGHACIQDKHYKECKYMWNKKGGLMEFRTKAHPNYYPTSQKTISKLFFEIFLFYSLRKRKKNLYNFSN